MFPDILFTISVMAQVDTEYKLQDMKKAYKELELKAKGYKKRLDDLQTALIKHMVCPFCGTLKKQGVFIILKHA